jgi:hypothetical protein
MKTRHGGAAAIAGTNPSSPSSANRLYKPLPTINALATILAYHVLYCAPRWRHAARPSPESAAAARI